MQLSGRISEDLSVFSSPLNLKKHAGIVRVWIISLGASSARFFSVDQKGIWPIGQAKSLDNTASSSEQFSSFYSKLAKWLHEILADNPFDRLLFVGSDKDLTCFNDLLTHHVACRIVGEAHREVDSLDESTLIEELKRIVWG